MSLQVLEYNRPHQHLTALSVEIKWENPADTEVGTVSDTEVGIVSDTEVGIACTCQQKETVNLPQALPYGHASSAGMR